jgi:hypothetical protein
MPAGGFQVMRDTARCEDGTSSVFGLKEVPRIFKIAYFKRLYVTCEYLSKLMTLLHNAE